MELQEIYEIIKPQIVGAEIRQANGDSGDSSARGGHFYALVGMLDKNSPVNDNYEECMKGHEVRPGLYRRTNDLNHWGSNPNNFSRDQWQAMQLGFAVQGDKKRLSESMIALLLRGGFHQNIHIGTEGHGNWRDYKIPDISHPTHFSVFIRAFNLWWLAPILWICDLTFLGDLYFRKDIIDIDNMILPQMAYAQLVLPTPVSRLAWRLYDKEDALKKIDRYYLVGPDYNGIRGFAPLFHKLVEAIK